MDSSRQLRSRPLTGSSSGGTNVQAIFNVLHGPWIATLMNTATLVTTQFVPSFNPDGTFTGVLTTTYSIQCHDGLRFLDTDAAERNSALLRMRSHFTITDSGGTVPVLERYSPRERGQIHVPDLGNGKPGLGIRSLWTKFAP